MRVLNVSSTIDPVTGGGEAERSFQMTKSLIDAGIECRLLTVDVGLSLKRKTILGKGVVIPLTCVLRRFYIPSFSWKQINSIVESADLIHLMGHWSILNALVYVIARKKNIPYVVCPAGALKIFGRSQIFKYIYNLCIGKRIIRNASACIAVTDDEVKTFIPYKVNKSIIHVIPNGIARDDFLATNDKFFREKYGIGLSPFVLFVGRLNLIKGPDLLLSAFSEIESKFPGIDLVFAGPDGGMLSELTNFVEKLSIGHRVHFIGYIGGEDKSYAYHAAELLVIPSRHEAMSIVVLEAGVCSTPVLITDTCGFNEIADFHGGWVVTATVDGIKNGLSDILDKKSEIKRAGINIKKYVENKFLWSAVVSDYLRLYSMLLANPHSVAVSSND